MNSNDIHPNLFKVNLISFAQCAGGGSEFPRRDIFPQLHSYIQMKGGRKEQLNETMNEIDEN